MRSLRDEKRAPADRRPIGPILSLSALAVVEPASTLATLDNFTLGANCSWPLIFKAVRVSPLFGTSDANEEMSACEVVVPLACFPSSFELSK